MCTIKQLLLLAMALVAFVGSVATAEDDVVIPGFKVIGGKVKVDFGGKSMTLEEKKQFGAEVVKSFNELMGNSTSPDRLVSFDLDESPSSCGGSHRQLQHGEWYVPIGFCIQCLTAQLIFNGGVCPHPFCGGRRRLRGLSGGAVDVQFGGMVPFSDDDVEKSMLDSTNAHVSMKHIEDRLTSLKQDIADQTATIDLLKAKLASDRDDDDVDADTIAEMERLIAKDEAELAEMSSVAASLTESLKKVEDLLGHSDDAAAAAVQTDCPTTKHTLEAMKKAEKLAESMNESQ